MRFDGLAACFSLSEMGRRVVGAYRSRRATHSFWNDRVTDRLGYEFYRQFIGSGSLVFDVGANIGNRSKIFWQLGAQVVAIEPQPECAAFLRKVFAGRQRFELVEAALGASPGHGEMLISNANTVSSLSNEWVERVRDSGRFPECTWDQKLNVPIETLDHLIAAHGVPAFVKIDVEGFEEQVLAGLSQPVTSLSFEYTPECAASALRCVERLTALGSVDFQFSLGESMKLELPSWVGPSEIRRFLGTVPHHLFGDIYARFA